MRLIPALVLIIACLVIVAAPPRAGAQQGLTPDLADTALTGYAFKEMADRGVTGTRMLWKYDDAQAKWSADGRSLSIDARIASLNTRDPQGRTSRLETQHLVVRFDPETGTVKVERQQGSVGDSTEADWAMIRQEFPDDDFFRSGGPASASAAAAPDKGFSASVFGNWTVARDQEGIYLKRKPAKTKAPCGWDAYVNATVTAKFLGASGKPKDENEALASAETAFKSRRQGATPNDMAVGLEMVGGREGASRFSMGEFKGAIADYALWLRRGSWGAGYTGESFGSNGAGQVVRNGEVIDFSYGVSGGGCWDNSSRPYLVSQGVAAQEEARQILASLRWDGARTTVTLPYLGPKYDGMPAPKPAESAASAPNSQAANPPPATEKEVVKVANAGGVLNNPTAPTVLKFAKNWIITSITTYHWNNGRGTSRPGTIALRAADGTVYGPWPAQGAPGQGGVPNAYWEVKPNFALPPGVYTVVDSDPSTWAQNEQSGGRGFVTVKGHAR